MDEISDPRRGIDVRWGLEEDEEGIAEIMDLNGMCRALAFEERFIVAERDGKVLAALRYRTEPKRLLLGLFVSDPWTQERPLAVALYAGAGEGDGRTGSAGPSGAASWRLSPRSRVSMAVFGWVASRYEAVSRGL
jgi:hypothetical protein